jgi:hypothetical protein
MHTAGICRKVPLMPATPCTEFCVAEDILVLHPSFRSRPAESKAKEQAKRPGEAKGYTERVLF